MMADHDTIKARISHWLRELAEEKSLTVTDLAEYLGLDRETANGYVGGNITPHLTKLLDISRNTRYSFLFINGEFKIMKEE